MKAMGTVLKIFGLVLFIAVLLQPVYSNAELPDYSDDTAYSNFAGRLYIPEVGIDVALYRSNKQNVVDRDDSAAYFEYRHEGHNVIADHWTQGFATLKDVISGMEAIIIHPDGTMTHYTCAAVFDGHNTGKGITDLNGRFVHGDAPLLMYTCIAGWQDVRVCLWEENNTGDGN